MKRKLLYIPAVLYTQKDALEKIMQVAKEKFGDYCPTFLDPTNCQYSQNEKKIQKLEKEINTNTLLCFANFTRTLREDKIWWDIDREKWEIYFWCKDEQIRSVYDVTNYQLKKWTDIEDLYKKNQLNDKGYL